MISEQEIPDEELIAKLKAGNAQVYRALVERYQNLIFTMIMRQNMQHEVAEELTQEVFLKAYKGIKKFKGQAKFSTWLVRIALNHTSSYYKSREGRQKLKNVSLDLTLDLSSKDSPQKEFEQKEFFGFVRNEFLKLKPKLQHVFTLCVFESKTYEDVASILEIPVGTVRSRLNTARTELQSALKDKYEEVSAL